MTRKEELVNTITREELYKCWIIDNLTYPEMINHFGLKKRWELTYLLRYYEFPRKDSKLIGKSSSKTQKETWNNKSHKNRLEQKGKLCRTIAEQKMYDFLITQFDDVVYDKKIDDRYPNFVDFYIPSLDLFIELNAHPAHGRLPFSKMSFEEYSKYPTSWADTFAVRDVEKQKSARLNNLNYIMIYPSATLNENLDINNYDKDLVTKLYKSQFNR